jgi:chromosome segregation ATPase
MEIEQISKRLEWLDDERRKDKNILSALDERMLAAEGIANALQKQVSDLSGEVSHLVGMAARFDLIESSLAQMRVEFSRNLENIEKQREDHEREVEKIRRGDMEGVNKSLTEIRKPLEGLPEIRKNIQTRVDEDYRLARLIEEVDHKVIEVGRSDEEYRRAQKVLEENRRQDAKRLADLQVEVTSLRKRTDEQRGKVDVSTDNVRRLELRINEILTAETERKQAQNAFIERQNMAQVERDRAWKEWEGHFEDIKRQASSLDVEMQNVDATLRTLRRSQEAFDEITQTFDRRVNELTEMQRLSEDRFRQEWVAFKADDQKRWTNYTLSNEEQQREASRQVEKQNSRLVSLEDTTQELKDLVHQVNMDIQRRLLSLVEISQKWADDFEHTIGKPE